MAHVAGILWMQQDMPTPTLQCALLQFKMDPQRHVDSTGLQWSPGPVRLLLIHGVRTKMKPHILLRYQHLCGLTVSLRSEGNMSTGIKSATDGMEGGCHLDQRPLRETAWKKPQQVSKSWSPPKESKRFQPKPPWTVKRLIPRFQQSAGRSNCRAAMPATDQICTNRAHAPK